ncbi:YsnF/AvaK domain-containing protein [Dyadobacter sp. CY347]|uniref:YsnF/AvaK domain-containing protein n=1 Tax=Dyadobacter sp. CY347 TaxID=2909336 RepID=UPI001F460A73|nr:YsnF/AvaK domain-containing protein [Dyadobacter sp. CY347]MCF2488589.1 YsnF/AvaK domain-containing protein [Dyadobacter sp. CY347]
MSSNIDDAGAGHVFSSGETQKIPVIEEKLMISSKLIETGTVSVSKKVLEEEVFVDATVTSDVLTVERKEINQYVDSAPPAVRQEGDVTIFSVVKEVLVVEKRLMLVEEIHITKHQDQDQKTFSQILRKEEVTVCRDASGMEI